MLRSMKNGNQYLCVFFCCVLLSGFLAGCGSFPEIPRWPEASAGTQPPSLDQTESTEPSEPEYIDTPVYNELRLYAQAPSEITVTLSEPACEHILEMLAPSGSDFRMAEAYHLDAALERYRNTVVDKKTETTLLTNGLLDANKLLRKVQENNAAVTVNGRITLNPFFSALDESQIMEICQEITRVINSKGEELDISLVANTLERLTVFTRSGSTSNAYVSSELAFVYNPNMIDLYTRQQEIRGGSPETVWQQVIDHEIMHLIQHGANDGDDTNGVEIGICRMYNLPNEEKTLLVDSLYNTWILEAGAEIGMTEVVGVEPGTYQKKISYARSYNISRFYELQTGRKRLEKAAFCHTLEDAYAALGLSSEEAQLEFLKFLYSVEITQMDPADFWASYEAQNGVIPEEAEQTGIRMDIRTDAVTYMTRNFFANLAYALRDGAIADLDTVFYMLRLWEMDTWNHLNYTQRSSLTHAMDFVLWYDRTQEAFLTTLAESNGIDPTEMLEKYDGYCLLLEGETGESLDNCDLSRISDGMRSYLLAAKDTLSARQFSRIRDVARWLAENEGE